MDQYRTSGVLDEDAYRETSWFWISRKRIWFIRIFAVIMGLFAILMMIVRDYLYVVLFLIFTVLFAMGPWLLRKLSLHRTLKRIHEVRAEPVRIETFFTVEGISLCNLSSEVRAVLPYENIRAAAETEHYFFLNTKANQFTLVFKNCLTPEQQASFLPFLKEKCPKLKIMR